MKMFMWICLCGFVLLAPKSGQMINSSWDAIVEAFGYLGNADLIKEVVK